MADNEWTSVEDKVHGKDVAFKVTLQIKQAFYSSSESPQLYAKPEAMGHCPLHHHFLLNTSRRPPHLNNHHSNVCTWICFQYIQMLGAAAEQLDAESLLAFAIRHIRSIVEVLWCRA